MATRIWLVVLLSFGTGCATGTLSQLTTLSDFVLDRDQGFEWRSASRVAERLDVGVAFVPDAFGPEKRVEGFDAAPPRITEQERIGLLRTTKERLESWPWVRSVRIVPTSDLRPRGGTSGLERIGRRYRLDAILVASYEQVQFVSQNAAALGYLSVVGAYLLRGETIDTRTSVDLALLELGDSRLLCRALGADASVAYSSWVGLASATKQESERGFGAALPAALANLERQARTLRSPFEWAKDADAADRTVDPQQ